MTMQPSYGDWLCAEREREEDRLEDLMQDEERAEDGEQDDEAGEVMA